MSDHFFLRRATKVTYVKRGKSYVKLSKAKESKVKLAPPTEAAIKVQVSGQKLLLADSAQANEVDGRSGQNGNDQNTQKEREWISAGSVAPDRIPSHFESHISGFPGESLIDPLSHLWLAWSRSSPTGLGSPSDSHRCRFIRSGVWSMCASVKWSGARTDKRSGHVPLQAASVNACRRPSEGGRVIVFTSSDAAIRALERKVFWSSRPRASKKQRTAGFGSWVIAGLKMKVKAQAAVKCESRVDPGRPGLKPAGIFTTRGRPVPARVSRPRVRVHPQVNLGVPAGRPG
ncbi:hypothetical protein B0H19DRAFT_1070972 [Mycena capillaripes]|nr:hypothetical protein B0H19DRAFT_1070972 [Mycena capillaripes]